MFVSCMAFYARVSDPVVGGTYMTLLNTITNLGGNWPSALALWLVDPLTSKECRPGGNMTAGLDISDNLCADTAQSEVCTEAGGSCHTLMDGYYLEILICFLLGMSWLSLWGWRTINYLTEAPEQEWRVVKSSKEK